jgi:membrane metallo-endopeptidase-like protein 1
MSDHTHGHSVIADYLAWRVVYASLSQMDRKWRQLYESFNRAFSGRRSEKVRWSVCMQHLFRYFSVPLGALYVRAYFDAASKRSASAMIEQIRAQFVRGLARLEWMDDQTRTAAIQKAHSIRTLIGYSDEVLDPTKVMMLYEAVRVLYSTSMAVQSDPNCKLIANILLDQVGIASERNIL